MADTSNLSNYLKDVADAIREKKGTEEPIPAANFDTEILSIETGSDTADATATVNDILNPKTAYIASGKVTGGIISNYEPVASGEFTIKNCNLSKLTDRTYTQGFAISPDGKVIAHCNDKILYFYVYNEENDVFEYKGEQNLKSTSHFHNQSYLGITVSSLGAFGNNDSFVYSYFYDVSSSSRGTRVYEFNVSTGSSVATSIIIDAHSPCRFLLKDNKVWVLYYENISYRDKLTLEELTKTSDSTYSSKRLFQVFDGPSSDTLTVTDFINDKAVIAYYITDTVKITYIQSFNEGGGTSFNEINSTIFVPNPSMNYVCQDGSIKHLVYNTFTGEYHTTDLETPINIDDFEEDNYNKYRVLYKWIADDIITIGMEKKPFDGYNTIYGFKIYKINYDDNSITLMDTFDTINMSRTNKIGIPFYLSQTIDLFNTGSYLSLSDYNEAVSHYISSTPSENLISFTRNGINYMDVSSALTESSQVLEGCVFYAKNAKNVGSMPNNGNLYYEASTSEQVIPAGYTSGGTIAPSPLTEAEYESCLGLSEQILGENVSL